MKINKLIIITIILTTILTTSILAQEVNTGIKEELENLYQYESLEATVTVDGQFTIEGSDKSASADELTTTISIFPYQNFYQTLLDISTTSQATNENINEDNHEITLEYENPEITSHEFSINSKIKTSSANHKLTKKVDFPIKLTEEEINNNNLNEYLKVTETIDWETKAIQAKAAELSQNKDDLFEVTFALAYWVEENIEYDLSTLNSESSLKASTVLQNKNGVCDEMTSLFLAMSRSLGIPAKFVSGLTYSNSELFDEPWQAHGWAEVYFPDHGWVTFDPTFGQYGYVDATHIPMKESSDPKEYSSQFSWLGSDIELTNSQIEFNPEITSRGDIRESPYNLNIEILSNTVQFGSYNLITAYLDSKDNSYTTSTLELFVPQEIEVISKTKQSTIIPTQNTKAIYWLIKVDPNLKEGYSYTFPYVIRTDLGETIENKFTSNEVDQSFTKEELEQIIPTEKSLSALEKISVNCDYETTIQLGTENPITCQIKNIHSNPINNLQVCHQNNCQTQNLDIAQTITFDSTITESTSGFKSQSISVTNNDLEYTLILPLQVQDTPNLNIEIDAPTTVNLNEDYTIKLKLTQDSFTQVDLLNISLEVAPSTFNWEVENFQGEETITLETNSKNLKKNNEIIVTYNWKDQNGNFHEKTTKTELNITPNTTKDKFMLLINRLNIFFASI